MRTLLNRGLVEQHPERDHETGAQLYRTSSYFLERIGVSSIEELPELAPFLPGVGDFEDGEESQLPAVAEEEPAGGREAPAGG